MTRTQTLIATALLTLTTQAHAITCEQQGNLAAAIMKSRQAGTALSTVLRKFQGVSDPAARQALEAMAIRAYETPRYTTSDIKQRAIADFRADAEVACYGSR